MRLALVGWASETGVGRELKDTQRNLPTVASFVMPHPGKQTPQTIPLERMRNPEQEMNEFLEKFQPDTVLTWETPGDWRFPRLWDQKGIRWVHVVHWDWFHPGKVAECKLATLIAPNGMCQRGLKERYALDSTLLPVPIDTDVLLFRERKEAKRFVSIYGMGGPNDRRSIGKIIATWRILGDKAPSLEIRAQVRPKEIVEPLPVNVSVKVGTTESVEELYRDADVAVQPSRFEGVGISLLEAQALGVPVITTAAEPMSDLVSKELQIACESTSSNEVMQGHPIEMVTPKAADLASKVEQLSRDGLGGLSAACSNRVREQHSWKALKGRWLNVLRGTDAKNN